MKHNELSSQVIKAAIAVAELKSMGIPLQEQVAVPIIYRGQRLATDLRIDVLVQGIIVVEVKAVAELHPIHTAQLLTYLKLTEKKLGLLINFNTTKLVDGLERVMNGYLDEDE